MNLSLKNRLRLLFRKDKEAHLFFYRLLGVMPSDVRFYMVAISHKSVQGVQGNGKMPNNERLEFLGDSVLGMVVSDILFKKFRDKGEGFLTKMKSVIVRRTTLNKVAVEMGIDSVVRAQINKNCHTSNIPGNVLEAVVGAIYLDRGYRECYRFISDIFLAKHFSWEEVEAEMSNPKSELLEWGQKTHSGIRFDYQERKEKAEMIFSSSVYVNGRFVADAQGFSKKEADKLASAKVLGKIRAGAV